MFILCVDEQLTRVCSKKKYTVCVRETNVNIYCKQLCVMCVVNSAALIVFFQKGAGDQVYLLYACCCLCVEWFTRTVESVLSTLMIMILFSPLPHLKCVLTSLFGMKLGRNIFLSKCVIKLSRNIFLSKHLKKVSRNIFLSKCLMKVSRNIFLSKCVIKLSRNIFLLKSLMKVSRNIFLSKCLMNVCGNIFLSKCVIKLSRNNFFYQSVCNHRQ